MAWHIRTLVTATLLFCSSTSLAQEPPVLDREQIEREIAEFEAKERRYSRVGGPIATMVTGGVVAGLGLAVPISVLAPKLLSTGYSRDEDEPDRRPSILLPVGLSCFVVGSSVFAGGTLWLTGRARKRKEVRGEINSRHRLLEDTASLQLIPAVSPEGGTLSVLLAY